MCAGNPLPVLQRNKISFLFEKGKKALLPKAQYTHAIDVIVIVGMLICACTHIPLTIQDKGFVVSPGCVKSGSERRSEWNNIIYRVANKVAVRGSEWNNNIYI